VNDIAGNYKYNAHDAKIALEILKYEGTPEAIVYFSKHCDSLTDYNYWFILSTLWVSYSGHSDLNLWKRLFGSDRPRRGISIMKPSERKAFRRLPYFITVYRAHRRSESDWIAYTTDKQTAFRFARERRINEIAEYVLKKRDVIGYFSRRGESEIIMLDPQKLKFISKHSVPDESGLVIADREDRMAFIEINGKWTMIPFRALKEGNLFRLYEANGVLISDKNGVTEFMAMSDAYEEEGKWQVRIQFDYLCSKGGNSNDNETI
jgi:hypothetical protein